MQERGWGAQSAKDWEKGILPGMVNKQSRWAREAPVGAGAHTQQQGAGKLVRVAGGGKLHRMGGRLTSQVSCKQTCRPEKVGVVSHPPVCLERGKLVAEVCTQENSE
jgi:hypothetical protein